MIVLSNVIILIGFVFNELCVYDIDTNNLKAILDPLTINTNIINKDNIEDVAIYIDIKVNNVIINSSNLNIIKIIFFRHQQILKILIINMIFIMIFSTSKVDILIKLFRTFGNIIFIIGINFY